jgi:hypothetical protein
MWGLASQALAHNDPERAHAVAPADLLAFGKGSGSVLDWYFGNVDMCTRKCRRNLWLDAESLFREPWLHSAQHGNPKQLVAAFHVVHPKPGGSVTHPCEDMVSESVQASVTTALTAPPTIPEYCAHGWMSEHGKECIKVVRVVFKIRVLHEYGIGIVGAGKHGAETSDQRSALAAIPWMDDEFHRMATARCTRRRRSRSI